MKKICIVTLLVMTGIVDAGQSSQNRSKRTPKHPVKSINSAAAAPMMDPKMQLVNEIKQAKQLENVVEDASAQLAAIQKALMSGNASQVGTAIAKYISMNGQCSNASGMLVISSINDANTVITPDLNGQFLSAVAQAAQKFPQAHVDLMIDGKKSKMSVEQIANSLIVTGPSYLTYATYAAAAVGITAAAILGYNYAQKDGRPLLDSKFISELGTKLSSLGADTQELISMGLNDLSSGLSNAWSSVKGYAGYGPTVKELNAPANALAEQRKQKVREDRIQQAEYDRGLEKFANANRGGWDIIEDPLRNFTMTDAQRAEMREQNYGQAYRAQRDAAAEAALSASRDALNQKARDDFAARQAALANQPSYAQQAYASGQGALQAAGNYLPNRPRWLGGAQQQAAMPQSTAPAMNNTPSNEAPASQAAAAPASQAAADQGWFSKVRNTWEGKTKYQGDQGNMNSDNSADTTGTGQRGGLQSYLFGSATPPASDYGDTNVGGKSIFDLGSNN